MNEQDWFRRSDALIRRVARHRDFYSTPSGRQELRETRDKELQVLEDVLKRLPANDPFIREDLRAFSRHAATYGAADVLLGSQAPQARVPGNPNLNALLNCWSPAERPQLRKTAQRVRQEACEFLEQVETRSHATGALAAQGMQAAMLATISEAAIVLARS